MSKKDIDFKTEILEDNEILYKMHSRPMNETCMCWGLDVPDAWLPVVDRMSKSLEALNLLFYPRFRVRIQMDQVKDKWAQLTCYHSIAYDPPRWMCRWHDMFQYVFDKLARVDYKFKTVVDQEAYDEVKEETIASREQFEEEKKKHEHCCNVEIFEKDGKFIKKATYHRCAKCHSEPTKHKLLHKLLKTRWLIEDLPARIFMFEPSHEQICIGELLDAKAYEIVAKAEKECTEMCEQCGHHISDESEYSPRCTTRGWVSYLCKECADKSGQRYAMNGAVWQNGKEVLSKQEYAEECAKFNIAK